MFATIRRHQSWLWVGIAAVTIGSFVILGPTNAKMGNIFGNLFGGQRDNFGVLAGQPLSRDTVVSAQKEVMLGYFLKSQQWPNSGSAEVQRETYLRLMLLQKQKELGVQVSTEAAAAFARRIVGPNSGALDQFAEQVLKPAGLNTSDFENFLHHELGIEQLMLTAGVSGKLVTPQEAETMYRLEHRDLETSIVYFSASNYLTSVMLTPEGVGQFYTNQLANYRVPDQVRIKYVKFTATNYTAPAIAAITNLEKVVDTYVQRLGTNLFQGTKTAVESRQAVKNDIIRQSSVMQARKAAGVFADNLDQAQPHTLDNFAKLAATNGLAVLAAEPFGREYGPQDLKVLPGFAQKAFTLTAEDPFGGPIMAEDGVYVIALVERQPAHTPAFKDIEEKVTSDYRLSHAFQLAQQTAIKFSTTVSNGLAGGKSFSALCAQQGLRSQALPLFSLDTASLPDDIEERVNFGLLKQVAFGTPPGKASPPAAARDGAFILYVEKLLPVDEAKLKAEMPGYLARVRQMRQNDAFQQWFSTQMRQDPEFMHFVQQLSENPQVKSSGARRSKS